MKKMIIIVLCFLPFFSYVVAKERVHKNKKLTPIQIGAIVNLTGDQAPLGTATKRGMMLALDAVNAAHGIHGRPLKIQFKDGETSLTVIKHIAREFANNPQIRLVIGLSDTDMVNAAAPIIAKAHKLFITSGTTSPSLLLSTPKYLYFVPFTDNIQAAAAAQYLSQTLKINQVAVVYDRDMHYTKSLASYFTTAFVHFGGTVVKVISVKHDASMKMVVHTLKKLSKPLDAIYLAAGPSEAPKMIKSLRQAGLDALIIGGDSYVGKSIIQAIGPEVANICYTTHAYFDFTENVIVKKYVRNFIKRYHVSYANAFSALGYDTVNLVAILLRKSPELKTVDFIQTFNKISNFHGVTGIMNYSGARRFPHKSVFLVCINHDVLKLTAIIHPSYIPSPLPI